LGKNYIANTVLFFKSVLILIQTLKRKPKVNPYFMVSFRFCFVDCLWWFLSWVFQFCSQSHFSCVWLLRTKHNKTMFRFLFILTFCLLCHQNGALYTSYICAPNDDSQLFIKKEGIFFISLFLFRICFLYQLRNVFVVCIALRQCFSTGVPRHTNVP
jgi:hypothetical protein